MIYIESLKAGDNLNEVYLVKSATKGTTINGNQYLSVVFQDKTGTITMKKWKLNENDENIFKTGQFVNVSFEIQVYKEKIEGHIFDGCIITHISNMEDYIPSSPIAIDILLTKLEKILSEISNPILNKLINSLYAKHKEKFIDYPAAVANHHAFKSGLIYHTVSMLETAKFLGSHYDNIDIDLLLSAVFCHDIGKVYELSGPMATEYTFEGRLLGHLVIAVKLIDEVAKELNIGNDDTIILLEHAVLASHGKYEFGSPVLGGTKEAILLNFIDDLDAKMMMFDSNIKEIVEGQFTKPLGNFDNRRLYKKKASN